MTLGDTRANGGTYVDQGIPTVDRPTGDHRQERSRLRSELPSDALTPAASTSKVLPLLVCVENRPMTIEYAAVAVGTFLIVVILIWKKLRTIDVRLREMQAELNELHSVESRLFIMALNANPKTQAPKAEPTIASAQSNGGRIVAEDRLECLPQSPSPDIGTPRAEGDEL
jgi:hypothetical protein